MQKFVDTGLNIGSGILGVITWMADLDPLALWVLVLSVAFFNVARGIAYLRGRKDKNETKD